MVKKKYQEELKNNRVCEESENRNLDDKYNDLAKQMKKAASEALKTSKVSLTPKRKNALNRLNKALTLYNKRPYMETYKWKVNNRKEEFQLAVRQHKEKVIKNFYQNLNDFDVAVRIKKSYNFLRNHMKTRRKHSGKLI